MGKHPGGASWHEARTLRVRAELDGPIRVHRDWPAPFDGLLSSPKVIPRRATARTHGLLPNASLPIVVSYGVSSWWWWASCATPDPVPSWWRERWNLADGEDQTVVLPRGTALEWWVIGEPSRLSELLTRLPRIGLGHGRPAASWGVADEGEPDYALVALTDEDTPGRPFPARYASGLGWPDDVETIPGASRPPYSPPVAAEDMARHAARHTAPVIAPWAVTVSEPPARLAGSPPAHRRLRIPPLPHTSTARRTYQRG